jgi:hypothetical protein
MEKLTITAHMKTPFITGGGYMTFDALLAGILFDQLQDVEAAHSSVPIRCTDGLFHASAAMYEPLDQSRVAFVANMRADHSLDADLFPRKKNGASYRKVGRLRRRDFGAVMNSYDSVQVESLEWHVEGDNEEIFKLINPISFIGKRRASGFGEVDRWSIEPSELDGLTGFLDEPMRPIPIERFKGDTASLKVDAAWRPAYWHPANRAICYAPELTQ